MRASLLIMITFLLCLGIRAQNPLSTKDSADARMRAFQMEKAIPLYKEFIKEASKAEKKWLPLIYAAYDSLYFAARIWDKHEDATTAVQTSFALARKYKDSAVLFSKLTSLVDFYKEALTTNLPLTFSGSNGPQRESLFKIISVKKLTVDSCIVTFAGGTPEGLKVGSAVECMGIKQPFLETDRSTMLLGRGYVTSVLVNKATALVILTNAEDSTGYIYKNDIVSCIARPDYKYDLGPYQFLVDYEIEFQDNYKDVPYHRRQLLHYPIHDQVELLDSIYLAAVYEIAEMLKDDTTGNYRIKISNGLLQGMFMLEALAKTKVEHIRSFLEYVATYPGKYYGMKFRFSEVFATWLINSSPLSDGSLMALLTEYRNKPYFEELLSSYDSSIVEGKNWLYWKNTFIDSLDRGVFLEKQYDVLQVTAKRFNHPHHLTWAKVLAARVLGHRSNTKAALTKLAEAQKEFSAMKMTEELAFIKTQEQQITNQRVAKVAVQTSHFLAYSISFSSNGKYFATYGDEFNIKIWDSKLMRQITTINGHSDVVNKVTFNSNDRYFVSASDDETIKVWDVNTFQLYKTIHAGYRVKYATLNKIGDKIIAAGSDSCIKVYDFQSGKVDSVYRLHKAKINAGEYNPEYQNVFYSGGSDSIVYSMDVQTGEWFRWFKSGGRVAGIRVTKNRQYIAVLGDNGQIKVWGAVKGKYMGSFPSFKGKASETATQPVMSGFDISSKKKMIAFVDDKKNLCLGSLDSMNYMMFDLKLENQILELAFDQSGNSLLLTTMMGKMYLVNLRHFNYSKNDRVQWVGIGGSSGMITSTGFSSDGRLFGFQSGGTYVLDLATGKTMALGSDSWGQMRSHINFTRNDSAVFYAPLGGNSVLEQDLATGDTLYTLSTKPYYITWQNLSPDRKYFIANFYKKAFAIYDVATKKLQHTVPLDSNTSGLLSGAMFIPETNIIIIYSDVKNSLSFYKMDQPVLTPFARYTSKQQAAFYSVVYNRATSEVIAGCQDNNLYFFDAASGKMKDTINFDFIDKNEGISMVKILPGNKRLFICMNTKMFLFDLDTRKVIKELEDDKILLSSVELSPAGDLVAIGTFTGSINFYDTKDFKKVVEIQTFTDKEPVWITPDNYYISSRTSLKELYFKYNTSLYPFDQFDINFNRPDKVLERLGKADPELVKAYREAWTKRFKKSGVPESRLRPDFKVPEVKIINQESIPPIVTTTPRIVVELEFTDLDTTISSYNIWVNGIPEYGTRGKPLMRKERTVRVVDSITLTGSANVIQVACKNSNGEESLKEKFEVRNMVTDTTSRNTYLFVVSVSKYKDSRYNLQYATKDGRDLVNAFKQKYKEHLIVDTLFDEQATLNNILAWKPKMQKTRLFDRVVVYVSGHGVLDKNFDFYYATQNMDFKNPRAKGLAYESIEKLLDSIPARQKLLLMDACHSGEVDKEDIVIADKSLRKAHNAITMVYKSKGIGEEEGRKPRLGLSNSFELMQDLFANLNSGNGTVVISAAAGNSYAYESDEWKNGVFTYSLLHGLKDNQADLDNNTRISVTELQKYVSSQVQKLTKGAQKPTARQENLESDWVIW
jgi:WD40 repeat protein